MGKQTCNSHELCGIAKTIKMEGKTREQTGSWERKDKLQVLLGTINPKFVS
jgi:hypothetical protein